MVIVGVMHGLLVIMNRLDVMLVVKSVVKHVMVFMLNSMVAPVLTLVAATFVIIATMGVLIWCRVGVSGVVVTVARLNLVFTSMSGSVNSVLVVVNRLDVVLVVESMVEHMVVLMLNHMVILMLTLGFPVVLIAV